MIILEIVLINYEQIITIKLLKISMNEKQQKKTHLIEAEKLNDILYMNHIDHYLELIQHDYNQIILYIFDYEKQKKIYYEKKIIFLNMNEESIQFLEL